MKAKLVWILMTLVIGAQLMAQETSTSETQSNSTRPDIKEEIPLVDIPDTLDAIPQLQRQDLVSSGWSGAGGDDNHQLSDNIWYLGERPVHYCIKSSVDYPFSKGELSSMVSSAFLSWQQFFQKYRLDRNSLSRSRRFHSLSFPDGKERGLSLFFKEVSCEKLKEVGAGEELVFLFGKSNAIIDLYSDVNFENSYGVALRKGFNHDTYRNQGFVHIKNFSTDVKKVHHLLLHEIGHIFGMKHDSVYVMDEDVVNHLQGEHHKSSLGKIESRGWVYKLRQGQSIILTDRPTRGDLRDANCAEGFNPNAELPNAILRRLAVPMLGCYQAILHVERKISNRHFRVRLTITTKNGRSFSLVGPLRSDAVKPLDGVSPGIYSKWKIKNNISQVEKVINARALIDNNRQFPALGSLSHGRFSIGARLSTDRGPKLEIYIPASGRWWTIPGTKPRHQKVLSH